MVAVSLRAVWIHDADDLSSFVKLEAFGDHGEDQDTGVEFRERAGGRVQAVTTARRTRSIPVSCPWVEENDRLQLEEWAGQLILYRDPRGRKVWGIYPGIETSDRNAYAQGAVSFTIREVSHSEVV